MSTVKNTPLIIAISSRALFSLADSHRVFEEEGLAAYRKYQIQHENEPLEPGEAFSMVKKLLHINQRLQANYPDKPGPHVEILLLSRNSADTGLRVFNSIKHYGLDITRAAFCSGESPYRYVADFGCHLFLSTHAADVRAALDNGVAAATLLSSTKPPFDTECGQLKFAFDGDAVLFSDDAEKIYQKQGLKAFIESETLACNRPLNGGPFKPFIMALQALQEAFPTNESPIRTALITARSAPTHERVIHTLRAWNIRIDESLFLGGLDKTNFLKSYGADVFFDDQTGHCDAAKHHVATGHVPYGVINHD